MVKEGVFAGGITVTANLKEFWLTISVSLATCLKPSVQSRLWLLWTLAWASRTAAAELCIQFLLWPAHAKQNIIHPHTRKTNQHVRLNMHVTESAGKCLMRLPKRQLIPAATFHFAFMCDSSFPRISTTRWRVQSYHELERHNGDNNGIFAALKWSRVIL